MWLIFVLENIHFAAYIFVALVLFAAFWLYYDAFRAKKRLPDGIRVLGFLILAASFVIEGTMVEANIARFVTIQLLLRNVGYFGVLIGILCENVQDKPKRAREVIRAPIANFLVPNFIWFESIPVLLPAVVSLLYIRKAFFGLEAHVKPVALAFTVFTFAQLIALSSFLRESPNVFLFELFKEYGPAWMMQMGLYLLGALILGRWVFGYLLKQFETQLFMILSVLTVAIFLITAVTFTALLLQNIQDETIKQLGHDAKVLQYALDTKRSASIADAQVLAQNPLIANALSEASQSSVLAEHVRKYLLAKKQSLLLITDANGQVVARGDDSEKIGQSVSSDSLFKRAKDGNVSSTVITTDGVTAPIVSLRASAPIIVDKTIIGTVIVGTTIDTAFVDGIKTATGLEASVYGDATVAATTLVGSDTETRLLGIKETNTTITTSVLQESKGYSGSTTVGTTPYFASYLPLLDVDTNPAGMIFVGRPQSSVMSAASHSIELTFIATAVLVVFSIVPSYLIARSIARQL